MSTDTREMFGNEYRLTVFERDAPAPPATEKMLGMVLDELGVRGNFNFHAKGHLPQAPSDAKPKMSAMLAGNEILVSMRWGTQEHDSVSGSLFVPNGSRPVEVQKRMAQLLGQMNAEGWPELKLNGASHPATGSESSIRPIEFAPRSIPPPAPDPVPEAPSAPTAPAADKDDVIALALLKKADAQGVIKGYFIHDYLHRHHPELGNRNFVSETVARLEGKGLLRRVSVDAGNSKWQFTKAFLDAHGHVIADYEPLPEAVPAKPGERRHAVPTPAATCPALVAEVKATTSAPARTDGEQPDVQKVNALCDDLERLLEERTKAAAAAQEAQQALANIDSQMAAKKVEVALAMKEVVKRLGCEEES